MDFGIEFSNDLMGSTLCVSITNFVFIIVIWSTIFTESIILDLIKVIIFFFGCCGACVVQAYNMDTDNNKFLKILPCGMLVMITLNLFAIMLILMQIISKGMMNCVGEFIAMMFAVALLMTWVALYFVTDRHVESEFYDQDENGNRKAKPA